MRALWRVHQKVILCKVFSSVQMFFDVLNNKFDIAVKFFLNLGYTHILTRQKTARDFEDLFRAWALLLPVTFLTGDHVYKSDLTRSHLRVLTMINCIEPP